MSLSTTNISSAYRNVYESLCGKHPNVRLWHFQWSATRYLYKRFGDILPSVGGRVLDVGCGDKPYRGWFGLVSEYIGLDVVDGTNVDVVVSATMGWPLPDEYFDILFSSQVLEHVECLELTLSEMQRVIKKGGSVVLAFPFLYNEHGTPWDYRRFTVNGAQRLFPEFEITHLEKLGGIGSTLALLLLNWLSNFKLLKAALPIWIPITLCVNLLGVLLDKLDQTGAFYNNVLLVAKRPS